MSETQTRANPSSGQPADLARWVIATRFSSESGHRRLIFCNDAYYYWHPSGTWTVQTQQWLSDLLWQHLSDAFFTFVDAKGNERTTRVNPTINLIANVEAAIRAFVSSGVNTIPRWIGVPPDDMPNPNFLIPFKNGLLDIIATAREGKYIIHPREENFLTTGLVNVDFDPDATSPVWDECLRQWSDGDEDWQTCRNRAYGNCLIPYRGYAKWLLEYGQPRSGKGTGTNSVLGKLLGYPAMQTVKVNNLVDPFGLVGPSKSQVLVIAEADELTHSQDGRKVVALLKSAIGGDPVPVRRMYSHDMTPTKLRFFPIIQCNEMPHLPDASRGLLTKMIGLHFRRSYSGKVDLSLGDKLYRELPGIARTLADACVDLYRDYGKYPIPESTTEVVNTYIAMNNPVDAFLSECFVEDPDGIITNDELCTRRASWESDSGIRLTASNGKPVSDQYLTKTILEKSGWPISKARIANTDADTGVVTRTRGLKGLRFRSPKQ